MERALAGPLPDLFHVVDVQEWEAGGCTRSTRGLERADVGVVHAAFAAQVQGVLDRSSAGADGPLALLRLDPSRVDVPVRAEAPAGGTEGPHLYGPFPVRAVVEQVPLVRGPPGWRAPGYLAGRG